jgi:hypothetical protein
LWLEAFNSIKNPDDPIWNRTRDLPACSKVPQPTATPHNIRLSLRCKSYSRKNGSTVTFVKEEKNPKSHSFVLFRFVLF